MTEQLPVLQVVCPLLAAPVCVLLRRAAWARALAIAVAWTSFAIALLLIREVLSVGTISYHIGDWAPPLGIEYRITILNAFVLVVVSAIAAVVMSFDSRGGSSRLSDEQRYLYYAAFLLCLAGLLGMTITGDAFNVFVFLEISSLSTYALVSLGRERRALTSAFSYLILGTLGGVFYLLGVGFLYAMTGTLNFVDLAARLPPMLHTRTAVAGLGFMVVGLSIKLAVFPLHQWLPNAYTYAPPKISAFVAGTATKVSYYLLLRVIFTVFGAGFVFDRLRFDNALLPLSLAAMFVASLAAIYQRDVRRLLAYSSIAQVGYMTLGLSMHNLDGLTGGIVHLLNHGLTKSGLFLVVAAMTYGMGTTEIDRLAGFGRRMPLTAFAFVLGGASLIGVPGTAGFISKWYFVLGALESGQLWVAAAILLSSLLAVVYVWRMVEVAYFRTPLEEGVQRREAPVTMLVPMYLLIGAVIVFGFWTAPSAGLARQAASELLGALP